MLAAIAMTITGEAHRTPVAGEPGKYTSTAYIAEVKGNAHTARPADAGYDSEAEIHASYTYPALTDIRRRISRRR